MDWIFGILSCTIAFYVGGRLLAGVQLKSFVQCISVAIVVSILDITIGTLLKIVTLGILSLGIFNWLLNAILIQVADWFLPGFKVKNFWWALALAAVVSITSGVIDSIL